MEKTFLVDASIVSVFDSWGANKAYLGDVLTGKVIEDETFRFRPYEQIVSSKIVSQTLLVAEWRSLLTMATCIHYPMCPNYLR